MENCEGALLNEYIDIFRKHAQLMGINLNMGKVYDEICESMTQDGNFVVTW